MARKASRRDPPQRCRRAAIRVIPHTPGPRPRPPRVPSGSSGEPASERGREQRGGMGGVREGLCAAHPCWAPGTGNMLQIRAPPPPHAHRAGGWPPGRAATPPSLGPRRSQIPSSAGACGGRARVRTSAGYRAYRGDFGVIDEAGGRGARTTIGPSAFCIQINVEAIRTLRLQLRPRVRPCTPPMAVQFWPIQRPRHSVPNAP